MFEPIHGSAPKYRGLNVANPIASIWAGSMLLDHLGEHEAAAAVLTGIERAIRDRTLTKDMGGEASTSEVGDAIASAVTSG
jgi:3-isopropylmalate dehydrogenase